ncbi:hypothetical protein HOK68_01735 [Candidatus Woesearchaeota archaeon]|jgi:hypothetical protein|nr:hypothetical protein [Candidatus Woesearchaeota archaeon]MBT4387317.1 hypothetical protein [Candidatus Woesearchaeota archaeon]MBT4595456.1 hypothetical protein [Candidatus Woesearchaeota archaeon]MBT5741171.1 hypothetical protein [Candidatus Woesearchaeota archaeon]MBT6505482.1 hypothetical protein [Candidatus Woesearchaeota archaeon]
MKNKGQFQMMESVMFLVIFIILAAFLVVLYFTFSIDSQKAEIEIAVDKDSIDKSQIIFNLPEIKCSEKYSNVNNCIDLLKLKYLEPILKSNRAYYYNIFGNVKIEWEYIYPDLPGVNVLFDSEPENYLRKRPTELPVNIYNVNTNTMSLALLKITYYN